MRRGADLDFDVPIDLELPDFALDVDVVEPACAFASDDDDDDEESSFRAAVAALLAEASVPRVTPRAVAALVLVPRRREDAWPSPPVPFAVLPRVRPRCA